MSSISTSTVTAEQILVRLSSYSPSWIPPLQQMVAASIGNPQYLLSSNANPSTQPDYSRPSPAFSSRLTQCLHHYLDTADVNRLEEIKLLVEEEKKYRSQQGNIKAKRIEDTFKLQQWINTLQQRYEGQQQQKQTQESNSVGSGSTSADAAAGVNSNSNVCPVVFHLNRIISEGDVEIEKMKSWDIEDLSSVNSSVKLTIPDSILFRHGVDISRPPSIQAKLPGQSNNSTSQCEVVDSNASEYLFLVSGEKDHNKDTVNFHLLSVQSRLTPLAASLLHFYTGADGIRDPPPTSRYLVKGVNRHGADVLQVGQQFSIQFDVLMKLGIVMGFTRPPTEINRDNAQEWKCCISKEELLFFVITLAAPITSSPASKFLCREILQYPYHLKEQFYKSNEKMRPIFSYEARYSNFSKQAKHENHMLKIFIDAILLELKYEMKVMESSLRYWYHPLGRANQDPDQKYFSSELEEPPHPDEQQDQHWRLCEKRSCSQKQQRELQANRASTAPAPSPAPAPGGKATGKRKCDSESDSEESGSD